MQPSHTSFKAGHTIGFGSGSELATEELLMTSQIAIVTSRFNSEITTKLHEGALEKLQELGFTKENITDIFVPGAVEIPIAAQRLARTDKYAAIICLGAVIFGETPHFDFVCAQVSQGCQQVSLSQNLPIIFGVLTTNTLEQAQARAGGAKGHMGREAASAAFEMISVLRQI